MRAFLAAQRSWLTVERMPAYAPELNPVEGVWSNLKGGPLANRADETIDATVRIAEDGIRALRNDQQLLFGFLAQTGLDVTCALNPFNEALLVGTESELSARQTY